MPHGDLTYTIGQFALLSGLSIRALRHYDVTGVLRPAVVDERTRYRGYRAEQLVDANRIIALRAADVALSEMPAATEQALQAARARLLRRIDADLRAVTEIDATLGDARALVALKEQPEMLVACMRRRLHSYDDVDLLHDELRCAVPERARGPIYGSMWSDCTRSAVDCIAFVQLKSAVAPLRNTTVSVLPKQRVASVTVDGRKPGAFENAYHDLHAWIAQTGRRLRGPKSEWYLAPFGSGSDTLTDLRFPV